MQNDVDACAVPVNTAVLELPSQALGFRSGIDRTVRARRPKFECKRFDQCLASAGHVHIGAKEGQDGLAGDFAGLPELGDGALGRIVCGGESSEAGHSQAQGKATGCRRVHGCDANRCEDAGPMSCSGISLVFVLIIPKLGLFLVDLLPFLKIVKKIGNLSHVLIDLFAI